MSPQSRLSDPQLGRSCLLDPNVQLNVISGRKLKLLRPLSVGANAHIRSGSVLYASSRIGSNLETGHHVIIREETTIGNHVSIWNNTTIDYGCRIGNRVKIHCNGYIAQYSVLEDDVFLAPGVTFANDLFPGNKHAGKVLQGPIIKQGAQLGVNVTVLPGVTIGQDAIIGAGSVVTRDVPAGAVVWGNPARIRKERADLRWPDTFRPQRKDAARFYRKQLSNRAVYK